MGFIVRSSDVAVNVTGTGFGEALTETKCKKSKEWTSHKADSDKLGYAVQTVLGDSYRRSLAQCSSMMHLERKGDTVTARPFQSCRKRWCPVCAWRLSIKRWGQLVERMPSLLADNPSKFLMLTLTVKNCEVSELKSTVASMLKGWRKMTQHRGFPATGWLRSVEVTFPRATEAHPHIHVLLAVKPDYFSHYYVKKAVWAERWKKAMKLDYEPIVDVRRVKPMKGVADSVLSEALGGLAEVAKYVTKPSDLADRPEAAIEGLSELRRTRLIEGGGWLKGIFADEPESEDEIGEEEIEPEEAKESLGTFWWRAVESVYRRKL